MEALKQMLGYGQFMKNLFTNKREVSGDTIEGIHYCSAISFKLSSAINGRSRSIHYCMYNWGNAVCQNFSSLDNK